MVWLDYRLSVVLGRWARRTVRRIRSREDLNGWPRWPIIALTGNAMEQDQEACRIAGMDRCLTKPVNVQEVLNIVAATPSRDLSTV